MGQGSCLPSTSTSMWPIMSSPFRVFSSSSSLAIPIACIDKIRSAWQSQQPTGRGKCQPTACTTAHSHCLINRGWAGRLSLSMPCLTVCISTAASRGLVTSVVITMQGTFRSGNLKANCQQLPCLALSVALHVYMPTFAVLKVISMGDGPSPAVSSGMCAGPAASSSLAGMFSS